MGKKPCWRCGALLYELLAEFAKLMRRLKICGEYRANIGEGGRGADSARCAREDRSVITGHLTDYVQP